MEDNLKLPLPQRIEGFMKDYVPLCQKWGVDVAARLFLQDLTKKPEDNIKEEKDPAVQ